MTQDMLFFAPQIFLEDSQKDYTQDTRYKDYVAATLRQSEQSCVTSDLAASPFPSLDCFFLNVYGLLCGFCLLPDVAMAFDARGLEPAE